MLSAVSHDIEVGEVATVDIVDVIDWYCLIDTGGSGLNMRQAG